MKANRDTILTMRLINEFDDAAASARKLIATSFRTRLDATPNTSHRRFLVIESDGRLAACASITFGSEQSLFSENYLPRQVEKIVSTRYQQNISRSSICEIGGLSTDTSLVPSVRNVVAYFPWYARLLGFKFCLVTVTSYIRIAFVQSGTPFVPICEADPRKIPEAATNKWGRYYEYQPQTGVIELGELGFLDQLTQRGSRAGEFIIRPGCFAKVEV